MSIIRRILKTEYIILIFFHLIFGAVVIANFPFGKYFIGWDALNPEFNFQINIQRVFSSFWQENQGLGLLGGHGFAAVLPHNLIIYLLSLFLPVSSIRVVFTFMFLYLGGIGMYFLCRLILGRIHKELQLVPEYLIYFISLFVSLYYMLNLGTLQMFYIPLEAFVFHFTALPWLFFSLIKYLQTPCKKFLLFFILINFISSAQGFIPPLFVAYIFSLLIFIFIVLAKKYSFELLKKILLVLFLTIVVNAYWLVPLGYYTVTKSNIYLSSYNNLVSTPEFLEKNYKYGNLQDVALMKGFIWEGVEYVNDGNIQYVFQPWVNHYQNISVRMIGYIFFGLCISGILFTLLYLKDAVAKAFVGVFFFFFTGLTTNLFPFSIITAMLQEVPIYKQAFRAAFTKFSLGVSFSYSLFLGIGMVGIYYLGFRLLKYKKQKNITSIKISLFYFLICMAFLLYYALPTFNGNFLYKKLKIDMPKAYLQIIEYFKMQEDGRILELPMDCSEGWYNFKWGYTGSGFYWYGIRQPILSRTFDVWSNYNENFYWEANQALHEENYQKLEMLIDKYNIRWIIYDPNITHCRQPRALMHFDDMVSYFDNSSKYKIVESISSNGIIPIKLYRNLADGTNNFININNLQNIGPTYKWNDNDKAYYDNENYLTDDKKEFDIYYPFRSLFTKRKEEEKEFLLENAEKWISFKNILPKNLEGYNLLIGKLKDLDKLMPVRLSLKEVSSNNYEAYINYLLPEVYLDGQILFGSPPEVKVGTISNVNINLSKIFINGNEVVLQSNSDSYDHIFSLDANNTIQVYNDVGLKIFDWESDTDDTFQRIVGTDLNVKIPEMATGLMEVIIPKHLDNNIYGISISSDLEKYPPRPCNEYTPSNRNKSEFIKKEGEEFIRLISKDSRQCLILNFKQLPTSLSYLIDLKTRKIQGNNPVFYVSNNRQVHYLDEFIYNKKDFADYSFILPASFPSEMGYDLYFDNYSRTNTETINDFGGISIWEIPYKFLTGLKIVKGFSTSQESELRKLSLPPSEVPYRVDHPNPSYYQIRLDSSTPGESLGATPGVSSAQSNNYLVLSQSFDEGWKAYEMKCQMSKLKCQIYSSFPFLFGKEIKDHVLINNWENGWRLDNETMQQFDNVTIILVYLPQYLQYIGFGLLLLVPVIVMKSKK